MKKKISILVLCFFMMTIFVGGAVAKNDNPNKGPKTDNSTVVDQGQQKKFVDIDSDWAEDEINKAAGKGFMKGYEDGKFQPNKPITCLEVIVALMSTLEQEGEITLDDADVDSYDSLLKKIPDWGKVFVAAAIDEGILLESEMKTFNPNQGIKRYQVAIYFARMVEGGYGDYIEDFVGDKEESSFNMDSILEDTKEAVSIMDKIIDNEDAEELNIDEFLTMLDDLADILKDLDEENLDQEAIDEVIEDVEELISELDFIIEDAEEEELDDDIISELDKVMDLLEEIKSDLKGYTESEEEENLEFADENQIPSQARKSIRAMQEWRIMFGDTDGKFSPMRVVKRNELAAMLNRLDENYFSQQDYEIVSGILDDVEYDEEEEIFTLVIVDKDGDALDEIDFTDETRLYFDGKLVSFDEDIDKEKYVSIEDIKTGGKINVCIDKQNELVWVKIYSPEEE